MRRELALVVALAGCVLAAACDDGTPSSEQPAGGTGTAAVGGVAAPMSGVDCGMLSAGMGGTAVPAGSSGGGSGGSSGTAGMSGGAGSPAVDAAVTAADGGTPTASGSSEQSLEQLGAYLQMYRDSRP